MKENECKKKQKSTSMNNVKTKKGQILFFFPFVSTARKKIDQIRQRGRVEQEKKIR